jgi:hypothetical protein
MEYLWWQEVPMTTKKLKKAKKLEKQKPLLNIGSQSTGAGAGKVTFNP